MAKFEEQMCRAAAKSLMCSLDSLQSTHFVKNAFPDELIVTLSKLNLTEQTSLVHRARHFMAIALDAPALKRQLNELENQRDEQELEDVFFLQGAPLVLMRRLFGMHASEFSRRRNALKLHGMGSGRPPNCDEKMEHEVWNLWHANQELPERQRFIHLAEETGLDLHIIWSALRQYIDS